MHALPVAGFPCSCFSISTSILRCFLWACMLADAYNTRWNFITKILLFHTYDTAFLQEYLKTRSFESSSVKEHSHHRLFPDFQPITTCNCTRFPRLNVRVVLSCLYRAYNKVMCIIILLFGVSKEMFSGVTRSFHLSKNKLTHKNQLLCEFEQLTGRTFVNTTWKNIE